MDQTTTGRKSLEGASNPSAYNVNAALGAGVPNAGGQTNNNASTPVVHHSRKRPPPNNNQSPNNNNQRPRTTIVPPSLLRIDRELIADANSTHEHAKHTPSNPQGDCNHCKNEAANSIINLARGGGVQFNNTNSNNNKMSSATAATHQTNINANYPPQINTPAFAPQATGIQNPNCVNNTNMSSVTNAHHQTHSHSNHMNAPLPTIDLTMATAAAMAQQTAAFVTTTQAPQAGALQNSSSSSVVQLSIVQCKPSYTEPWKKLSPVSLVGTGFIIPWNSNNKSAVEGGNTSANNAYNEGEKNGNNINMRILTNAKSVQYATSIRVNKTTQQQQLNSSHCISSVGCTVEYISLAMDLALLRIIDISDEEAASWGKRPVGPSFLPLLAMNSHLPKLGENVTCLGCSSMGTASNNISSRFGGSSQALSSSQHQFDLNIQPGMISGYYAKEDDHYMLRMKMNLWHNSSKSEGGGVVFNGNGNIVGIVPSSSSSQQAEGFHSVIPACVIGNFLNQCNQIHGVSLPSKTFAAAASSASATTISSDETSQSDKKPSLTAAQVSRNKLNGINHFPGIPTLGITGYQTLENRALRRSLGLEEECATVSSGCGVRILGINHAVHPASNSNEHVYQQSQQCKEDRKCHTSMLRTDDVLLAVDDEPVRFDGTVRVAPTSSERANERVDFRWLISQRSVGSSVKLNVMRQRKLIQIHATLSAPRHLVPKCDEGGENNDNTPLYVICGGCVFVPLTEAWLLESLDNRTAQGKPTSDLQVFQRYMQEQRKGDQQIIILSHVLPDRVNVGYHDFQNMILTAVNGQKQITNIQMLMDVLVKRDNGQSIDFRCSNVHLDRAKVVICMDTNEVMEAEPRIMKNYMIESWSSDVSPSLRKEAEGKAYRHGVTCCLKTMKALRNAVRETTIVPVKRSAASTKKNEKKTDDIATTRRIMDFGEAHKMQSAPLFAGKYTEEGGWTQVKTKHLSQLCACGKSTRFYCICSVGTMRCKDCFIRHCRDHTNSHECSESCDPDCSGKAEVLAAEGVELVTTQKRKRNNPSQAVQSRCVVCRAKTCYCCSACGFENETALCHVSTGRNCIHIHATSEHKQNSEHDHDHDHDHSN